MSWDRIRGQDAARQSLQTAFARDRLGQAYLFIGPEGVGKRSFAHELAKALLCEKPPASLTACDRCPSCAQVEAETHPDFHSLRTPLRRHELPVDDMRAFCAQLSRKPARGGRVVGIVDDADEFNAESANSFLKTLEEPPAGAILLLIGTSTNRQLATILSRCWIVRFALLKKGDLLAVLQKHGVADAARRLRLVNLAHGSVSRALALNDEAVWRVREELVSAVTAERPNFGRLAETWSRFVEDAGKDTASQRMRASVAIGFLVDILRHALHIALAAEARGLDPNEEPKIRTFARRLGPDKLVELIDKCVEADSRIERRVQLVLVIESVLEQFVRPLKA